MPIKIDANTKEIDELSFRLNKKSGDFSEEMAAIATLMLGAVEDNFAEEGRPTKWHPLAEATKEERKKKGFGEAHPILEREGILAGANQPNSSNTEAEVTNATVYAAIQHFGGKAGRGRKVTIPERPFMILTDKDVQDILDVLSDSLEEI